MSAVPLELVARAARARAELGAEYPFEGRFLAGAHGFLHLVDEGPRDAPALLFLHGNPSWSFLWRRLIAPLAADWRVLALDHLGCGLSGPIPAGVHGTAPAYRLADRIADAERVLEDLWAVNPDHPVALVGHDWGGAIALGLARRHPGRIRALSLSNTAGFRSKDLPKSIRLCRVPLLGPLLLQGLNGFLGVAVRACTRRSLAQKERAGYLWPHRGRAARASIRAFVEDIPLSPNDPSWQELAAIEEALPRLAALPNLLLWGECDWCFHPGFRRRFEQFWPDARVVALPGAGHWWPEDELAEGLAALTAFAARAFAVEPAKAPGQTATRNPAPAPPRRVDPMSPQASPR